MFSEERFFYPVALALVAGMWLSCSILEDRRECPCHLSIDCADPSNYWSDSLVLMLSGENYSSTLKVGREDYDVPQVIAVPRSGVNVAVMDYGLMDYCDSASLKIPFGNQCPEAYMYSAWCDTSDEEAGEKVKLRKNYCGVSLAFAAADPEKYDMAIEGNICGYTPDGQPMAGKFRYIPDFDSQSLCYFRLPRQKDGSLGLSIASEEGETRTISLGSYIISSGYDWKKEDLDDIVITIDYASAVINISVNGWTDEVAFDVVF